MNTNESENRALLEYLAEKVPVEKVHLEDLVERSSAAALVVPDGKRLVDLKPFADQWRTVPERATGTAEINELASFIEFVNRFKTADTVIFADNKRSAPSLLAVLDYNQSTLSPSGGLANWGQHRVLHKFPVSDEWKTWIGGNKQQMNQETFAAWIEERILDVADPTLATERTTQILSALGGVLLASPAKLLALSKGLAVHVKSQLENFVKLDSGEANLVWKTEHQDEAGVKLNVPGAFLIAIPLFQGGSCYPIIVRLRYRVGNGAVSWSYALYRTEEFFDAAIAQACKDVGEKTSLPVIIGTPEPPATIPAPPSVAAETDD
jgi:uncharacterized protein YfdQ (DUF2303 family)